MTDAPRKIALHAWNNGERNFFHVPEYGETQRRIEETHYTRTDTIPRWQDISTVPVSVLKDKWSEVIVWDLDHERCELVRVDEEQRLWWGDWDIVVNASHWMPPPEPPKENE